MEGANDIRLNEVARARDRAVHMRFGGQVHDVRDGVAFDHIQNGGFVAQINLFKDVFRMRGDTRKVLEPPGVCQAIQVDQPSDLGPVNDVMDEIRADKTGSASDKQIHVSVWFFASLWVNYGSRTCLRLSSHWGSWRPNVRLSFSQESTEYDGRLVGVG